MWAPSFQTDGQTQFNRFRMAWNWYALNNVCGVFVLSNSPKRYNFQDYSVFVLDGDMPIKQPNPLYMIFAIFIPSNIGLRVYSFSQKFSHVRPTVCCNQDRVWNISYNCTLFGIANGLCRCIYWDCSNITVFSDLGSSSRITSKYKRFLTKFCNLLSM